MSETGVASFEVQNIAIIMTLLVADMFRMGLSMEYMRRTFQLHSKDLKWWQTTAIMLSGNTFEGDIRSVILLSSKQFSLFGSKLAF